jgi:hypothetical protein
MATWFRGEHAPLASTHRALAERRGSHKRSISGVYHVDGLAQRETSTRQSLMLKRDNIRVTIAAEQAKIAQRHNLTVDRIIGELALIGFANMLDYITLQADGSVSVDLSNLARDQAAAIQDITVDEYMDGRGHDARPVKRIKFKLSDKRAALVDLGKHLGMFKDLSESTRKLDATNAFLDIVKAMSAAHQSKLIEGKRRERQPQKTAPIGALEPRSITALRSRRGDRRRRSCASLPDRSPATDGMSSRRWPMSSQ